MKSITHFIPLIGPFEYALQRGGYNAERKYASLSPFKGNEATLVAYTGIPITYLDEVSPLIQENYYHPHKTDNSWMDCSPYKSFDFHTEFVLSVPPCAGLSSLNSNNDKTTTAARGADAEQNRWIYESVKFFIAQDSDCLIVENAPGLSSNIGVKVVLRIKEVLKYNKVDDKYTMHVIRTNTLNHGIPQHRERTFLYIYKNKNKNHQILDYFDHGPFKNVEQYLSQFTLKKDDPNNVPIVINKDQTQWLEFIKENKDWILPWVNDKINTEYKDSTGLVLYDLLVPKYQRGELNLDKYDRVKHFLDHYLDKTSRGLGIYDNSPHFISNHTGAVISRNIHRTLSPGGFDRYLVLREFMNLMALPQDLVIDNPVKNYNIICQSIPVTTALDAIKWGELLLNGDLKISSIPNNEIFLQKHNYRKKDDTHWFFDNGEIKPLSKYPIKGFVFGA